MIPFAYHTVERLRAVEYVDAGNTTRRTWDTPNVLAISGCNIQPLQQTEVESSERNSLVDRWRLFAPAGSDIRFDDRIRYKGVVYDVDGTPMEHPSPFGDIVNHIEINLRRNLG